MKQIKTIISQNAASRLDKFLAVSLKNEFNLSRTTVQKLIDSGQVTVNQKVALVAKMPILKGDQISVILPSEPEPQLVGQAVDFEIIYQDKDLLVVNKPNNLVVHPGAGNMDNTLVNGLIAMNTTLSDLDGWRPGVVHRLDKQTTGLIIIAKNNLTHQKLSEMFAQRQVKKEYIALVEGLISEAAGKIAMPIGRSTTNRKKMMVTAKNSKRAITHFEVLERFENATLVKVNLETGRTHQIRVHFSQIKHPIYNDPVYGPARNIASDDDFGQYLHASQLSFKHPRTQELMSFTAPLPPQFNDKIKALRKK